MRNGFFITGTDTGVGKTFVTALLAERGREVGLRVFAFKPIETGCELVGSRLVGSDQEILCKAAGNWQTGRLRGVYQYRRPVAPLVAAVEENKAVDVELLIRTLHEGAEQADLVLVEGAGGWRVPITEDLDMAGLAKRIGLPVIVVARATLGTINHTLLTVEAIERGGQKIEAVVLSRRPDDDPIFTRSNWEQIGRRWSGAIHIVDGLAGLDDLEMFRRDSN